MGTFLGFFVSAISGGVSLVSGIEDALTFRCPLGEGSLTGFNRGLTSIQVTLALIGHPLGV